MDFEPMCYARSWDDNVTAIPRRGEDAAAASHAAGEPWSLGDDKLRPVDRTRWWLIAVVAQVEVGVAGDRNDRLVFVAAVLGLVDLDVLDFEVVFQTNLQILNHLATCSLTLVLLYCYQYSLQILMMKNF